MTTRISDMMMILEAEQGKFSDLLKKKGMSVDAPEYGLVQRKILENTEPGHHKGYIIDIVLNNGKYDVVGRWGAIRRPRSQRRNKMTNIKYEYNLPPGNIKIYGSKETLTGANNISDALEKSKNKKGYATVDESDYNYDTTPIDYQYQ